ncbi:rhomboid family intramembrane serine protease [Luteolibacter luteus]|uniref:Rhomboid family intramembrane serine protease n=1 Tax=Luteolibacter luteus TaxID=2728835 RepID=A0A858REA3_9BACT|nr:rhomboid family intramembrane serine protease [Luteolibacter luteus]QJE95426.1 rhomboid family intramembrane serine protease [Luteolibacter luteus]
MGTADRDYFRDEEARYTAGGRPPLPPVTKFLLIANIAIFLIDLLTRKDGRTFGIINQQFCFTIESAFKEGRIWELVTFQFLHYGLLHIAFNCVALFFFGPWVERWWGTGRFIAFYLLCGVAGALFFTLLALVGILPDSTDSPLVGASAGIYGLMIGTAVISPNAMVSLLIPPVTLSMRTFAWCVIGLAVAVIVGDVVIGGSFFRNSGGEAGHLGGAILGFILMRFPFLLRKGSASKVIRPKEFRRKSAPKLRPRSEVDVSSSEVDRILDKIGREGIQSLTEREREILQKASKSKDEL